MRRAIRIAAAITVAVMAYGMLTAHLRAHPWLIIGPFAVCVLLAFVYDWTAKHED